MIELVGWIIACVGTLGGMILVPLLDVIKHPGGSNGSQ